MAKWQGDHMKVIKPNELIPLSRMKKLKKPDGTVVFIDSGVVETKKNRHRHRKDGTPKKMRGTQVTRLYEQDGVGSFQEVIVDGTEHMENSRA